MRKPKYNSLSEWRDSAPIAYRQAYNLGILPKICNLLGWKYLIRKKKTILTLNDCKTKALKCKTKKEWRYFHLPSYAKASKQGWINECCFHMDITLLKPKGYWTKEKCRTEANKYTIKDHWKKSHSPSYQSSYRNGWIKELSTHMKKTRNQ